MGILKTIGKGICGFVVIFTIALLAILVTQTIGYDSDNTILTSPIVVNNITPEFTPTVSTIPTAIKPLPIPTPTLTSTKVIIPTFPKATPTITSTPIPTATATTFPRNYRIEAAIFKTQWDENTIAFIGVNSITGDDEGIRALTHIEISIDNQVIAEFEPNIVKGRCGYIIEECPMIINLPNGMTNCGKITAIGTFNWEEMVTFKNGEYPVQVYCQTPPMRYEEEYNQFPIWNP